MTTRPPAPPPRLDGYEYERLLGSGDVADVHLYRRLRPQRRVAIKVLPAGVLDDSVRRRFDAEANVMATLSAHPAIVTIHQADITADHRALIVMEYCPRPNYGASFRRERIPVAEALRVGVQIAGAVETAHRAGILHRDIKPANILVTESDRPALTDFGISMATGGAAMPDDGHGLSISWSPPEAFADPPRADERGDVFSLAATVYSLLAGRTPFERSTGSNSANDLIARITAEPLALLTRPDVPAELNRTLSIAMAKDPSGRHGSALALGRDLQQIERAMSLPITQLDVLDVRGPEHTEHSGHTGEGDLGAHTNIRRVPTIDPDVPARPVLDPFAGVAAPLPGARSQRSRRHGPRSDDEATVLRPAASAFRDGSHGHGSSGPGAPDPEPAGRRRPVRLLVAVACALVIGLGVGTTVFVRSTFATPEAPRSTAVPTTEDWEVGAEEPPQKIEVTVLEKEHGTTPGTVRITWDTPRGMTESDDIAVEWTGLPEGYEDAQERTLARGGSSVTEHVPLAWDHPCVVLTVVSTGKDVGPASDQACVDIEELRSP